MVLGACYSVLIKIIDCEKINYVTDYIMHLIHQTIQSFVSFVPAFLYSVLPLPSLYNNPPIRSFVN